MGGEKGRERKGKERVGVSKSQRDMDPCLC